jgi:hypothetical protein
MVMHYQETKSQEHQCILARHKIIEDRKEYLERLNTVRVSTACPTWMAAKREGEDTEKWDSLVHAVNLKMGYWGWVKLFNGNKLDNEKFVVNCYIGYSVSGESKLCCTKCRGRKWEATAVGIMGLNGCWTGNVDTENMVIAVAALVMSEDA